MDKIHTVNLTERERKTLICLVASNHDSLSKYDYNNDDDYEEDKQELKTIYNKLSINE